MLVCKICFKSYYFVLALLNYVNSGVLGLILQTTKYQIFMMYKSRKIFNILKPYKHTQASVGAIYLTIMNLPYTYRYKRENIILLGIIPGPSEPPRDINQYLRPIVKESLHFYAGVDMIHNKSVSSVFLLVYPVICLQERKLVVFLVIRLI